MNSYHSKGFSLMELLIVIAIIGIIASLAAPSMLKLIQQYQVNGETRALVAAIQENRAKAILEKHNNLLGNWESNRENVILFGTTGKAKRQFSHDFMGRFKDNGTLLNADMCIRLTHQQNPDVESSILVRPNGSIQIFKNKKECKG